MVLFDSKSLKSPSVALTFLLANLIVWFTVYELLIMQLNCSFHIWKVMLQKNMRTPFFVRTNVSSMSSCWLRKNTNVRVSLFGNFLSVSRDFFNQRLTAFKSCIKWRLSKTTYFQFRFFRGVNERSTTFKTLLSLAKA